METAAPSHPEHGLFVRFAESDPQASDRRAVWKDAHKAHLRQSMGEGFRILLSGPMLPRDEGAAAAMVIARAPSLEAFTTFSERDPFVVHGIYNRIRILRWTPTLIDVPGFGSD